VQPPGFRGIFREDDLARAVYSEGAGIARAIPRAVAVPADADDVCVLAHWANTSATPLIPRGSASGMAGGAVGDGVIVDLSRLVGVSRVDETWRRVWAGAGATRAEVNEKARGHGLRFPVDPSSGAFCTVGGMAATNAAGAHSMRYGAMRAWVTALDCVFDDGTRATVRRGAPLPPDVPALQRFQERAHAAILAAPGRYRQHPGVRKDSSGYALADYARTGELIDLLVGSEGTLAMFVSVEVALVPVPAATCTLLAEFASVMQAVDAAARARANGASACELIDRTFLAVATSEGDDIGITDGAETVLLVEVEAGDANAAIAAARQMEGLFGGAGAMKIRVAVDPANEGALWKLRHAASPILARLDPRLKSMQFIEDAAVPPEQLATYVRGVRKALEERGIKGVIFGHAGDAHVHVNPLIDCGDASWRGTVEDVLEEVTELVSRLGGTLSGEHGDGRLRTPLLDRVWHHESRALFKIVKEAFDPTGILNPGVKVPVAGQRPVGDVKYDPTLPPLPAAARAALDVVERERAWNRSRLSMLGEGV
jgi:FAD/FMN-containing dehydrogenase